MKHIILCGGSGTRLWPISRKLFPKQFHKFLKKQSLFQETLKRNRKFCDSRIVVINDRQFFMGKDQLEQLKLMGSTIFLQEELGRNTAPAIALAALQCHPDDLMLITPSDHVVSHQKNYEMVLAQAQEYANQGFIVTFGIKPKYPETGFGYIEAEGNNVLSFKEKPDIETAKKYFDNPQYFWNSGMFCFKAKVFLEALRESSLEIFQSCQNVHRQLPRGQSEIFLSKQMMESIPADSIDYAVLEHWPGIKVVHADIGWSDIGSFDALVEHVELDSQKNAAIGFVELMDCQNNFVYSSTDKRVVSMVDVDELMVVDTEDALLITRRGSSQKVRELFSQVREHHLNLTEVHRTEYRPWGRYTILQESVDYKIKQIALNPRKRMSLQKHQHRTEHWVVVKGSARIIINEKELVLSTNDSATAPAGIAHRLENPTDEEVILIETQIGSYLGEDDIERLEDDYKRL